MKVIQFRSGPMDNLQYLMVQPENQTAIAIDPAWDASLPVTLARSYGCNIVHIWLTHGHFDHVNALDELVGITGATTWHHPHLLVDHLTGSHISVADNEWVTTGDYQWRVWHTPGHSQDSLCWILESVSVRIEENGVMAISHPRADEEAGGGLIITGDTLFVGACGRVDLPTSSPSEMMASLRRLGQLNPSMRVCPGHDYGATPTSTIAHECQHNSAMRRAMRGH
ncbi:MBL fold metallo-hydrolase [bacterium]|nr:MBL fold metallo-hydrolase [bacterium]